jgi:hypothetical protein
MKFGWPSDGSLYRLFTDWGGFIGAIIALLAAVFAYLAVRAQIKEARRTYLEGRGAAKRVERQEGLVAIYLIDAAPIKFKFDLEYALGRLDIGTSTRPDMPDILFGGTGTKPIGISAIVPYIGRIDLGLVRMFTSLVMASERLADPAPNSVKLAREAITALLERTKELQTYFEAERERTEALMKAEG